MAPAGAVAIISIAPSGVEVWEDFWGKRLIFRDVIVFRAGAHDVSRNQCWKHIHNTAGSLTKKQFEA